MDELMTLGQAVNEYMEQEKKVQSLNFSNLSESDRDLLASFGEMQDFFKELERGLNFTQHSTVAVMRESNGRNVMSLETMTSQENYVSEMIVLTNNFDDSFKAFVQRDMNESDRMFANAASEVAFSFRAVQEEKLRQQNEKYMQEITVREAQETLRRIEEEQAYLEQKLQEQKAAEQREQDELDLGELFEMTTCTVIAVETIGALEEAVQDKPIEIVEGNDGILNTSKPEEVSPSRFAEARARIDEKKASIEEAFAKGDKGNRENSEKNAAVKKDRKEDKVRNDRSRGVISR